LDIYWNILTMHGPINVKSSNNISKRQMGFNSALKGLIEFSLHVTTEVASSTFSATWAIEFFVNESSYRLYQKWLSEL
jgi:hypothetical protein